MQDQRPNNNSINTKLKRTILKNKQKDIKVTSSRLMIEKIALFIQ